ncbi:MFS transporter, partial [Nocardia brasiliensis]|uniref:MFS transporter n=1 Tax=Nocardia brasiliensis TaxID=37326 RepID=UPI0024563D38
GGVLPGRGSAGGLLYTVGFILVSGGVVWVSAGVCSRAGLRSTGSSAMLTSDLVANAIVAGAFLTMLESLGGAGTFAVFGALAIVGFGFVYRLAPETKGRQLEEIQYYWANGGRWPADGRAVMRDQDVRA